MLCHPKLIEIPIRMKKILWDVANFKIGSEVLCEAVRYVKIMRFFFHTRVFCSGESLLLRAWLYFLSHIVEYADPGEAQGVYASIVPPKNRERKIEGRNGGKKKERHLYLIIIPNKINSNCIFDALKLRECSGRQGVWPWNPLRPPFEVSGPAYG